METNDPPIVNLLVRADQRTLYILLDQLNYITSIQINPSPPLVPSKVTAVGFSVFGGYI
jgi:hypothetical protein